MEKQTDDRGEFECIPEGNNPYKREDKLGLMEARKIQKVGERSYSISLPKEWVKNNNLKEKDFIFMEISSNNIIIKSSQSKTFEGGKVSINIDKVKKIREFIILCYIRGVNRIKIFSPKFNQENKKDIEEIVNFLKGYETIRESEEEIEISFLFNEIKVTVDSLVKRMISILNFMVDAMKEKDWDSFTNLESKLDQIFHLSRRILFSCSRDPIKQSKNNLGNVQEIFFYMEVVRKLERLGDNIYRFKGKIISSEDLESLDDVIKRFRNIFMKKKPEVKLRIKSENPETDKIFLKINHDLRDLSQIFTSIKYSREFFLQ